MLVVAYALAGSLKVDVTKDPLGYDKKGQPVYLKDIWPTTKEIADAVAQVREARPTSRSAMPTSSRATPTGAR